MKIAEHLYVYFWADQRENNCNSIFVDGKVPLLIDPGLSQRADLLFAKMRKDGVEPSRTKVIICTHCHPDHFTGILLFKDRAVRIAISKPEERFIEEVGRPMYLNHGLTLPAYKIDFYLKDGDLTLGKHDFQIFLTPGHSPGGICIYWPRFKVLFSGDIVFMNGVGRTDLPGGDLHSLRTSINRLSQLPVNLLIPGHGPAIQGQENVKRNFETVKRTFLRQI